MTHSSYGIELIETYLPGVIITADELASKFGFDPEFIINKIGVKQLYLAEDQETTSDLAVQAMEKLLEKNPLLRTEIDILIVCTQTPDFQLPQMSALIQSRCKLPRQMAAFDINLGCSGFAYGVSILESFLLRNEMNSGVLITAETYSKIINPKDRNTKPLFSDAASATLISRQGRVRLGSFKFGTNGDQFGALIAKRPEEGLSPQLFMDGRKVFEFVISTIPGEVRSTCVANDVKLDDIDYFVFHQASKFVLDTLAQKLGISDTSRVINTLGQYGNTISSSIPMALKDTLALHGKRDLKLLISGFGVGLSWGTAVISTEGDCSNV